MVGPRLFVLTGALARYHRIHVLQSRRKEVEQVWEVHHTLREDIDNLVDMVLHVYENVYNELIWDVIETLLEVANSTLWMLLENLKFWVLLV